MILGQKKQIMAILNCTPDSFYDGGRYFDEHHAITRGLEQIEEGADIIDVGGESTRPYSTPVPIEEEIRRIKGVVQRLSKEKVMISIDSSKPEVVKIALNHGASFINDVTGFSNPAMLTLAKEYHCPVCLMHMQKNPQEMQINPHYPRGVVTEIYEWFKERIASFTSIGLQKEKIYLDVGIGFGKSVDDNLRLIKELSIFTELGCPLLIGLSRKSFMQKILNKNKSELLSTTLALNTMSLLKGVSIIRVHDIKEHKEIVSILERIDLLD